MSSQSPANHGSSATRLWDDTHADHDTIALRSLGFWLYMLSDAMIFAGLFAAHGAYTHRFAGSFTAQQVLHPFSALWPTLFIFSSVLAYGLGMVALKNGDRPAVIRWLLIASALGALFLVVETWTFGELAGMGATPQKSAFLSDYWVIVLAHGAHVFFGLLWMLVMIVQVASEGFSEHVVARLINLRIFWFFQAIIWVCVYSFVYLMGAS